MSARLDWNPNVIDLTGQVVDITRRMLVDAAIMPGMRVLDLGCGRGDVAMLVADLVGSEGQVLGVDRDESAVAHARQRAQDAGRSNLQFVVADIDTFGSEIAPFDALTTRRTLMYLADPAATLRRIATLLKPGAIVAVQEHDFRMVPASTSELPLHRKVNQWMWRTVEAEGANICMGFDLAPTFARAGLELETLRVEAIAQTPTAHFPIGLLARAMLPRVVASGVATADEIEPDTLDRRLLAERQAANATFIGDVIFCAIGRKPTEVERISPAQSDYPAFARVRRAPAVRDRRNARRAGSAGGHRRSSRRGRHAVRPRARIRDHAHDPCRDRRKNAAACSVQGSSTDTSITCSSTWPSCM